MVLRDDLSQRGKRNAGGGITLLEECGEEMTTYGQQKFIKQENVHPERERERERESERNTDECFLSNQE